MRHRSACAAVLLVVTGVGGALVAKHCSYDDRRKTSHVFQVGLVVSAIFASPFSSKFRAAFLRRDERRFRRTRSGVGRPVVARVGQREIDCVYAFSTAAHSIKDEWNARFELPIFIDVRFVTHREISAVGPLAKRTCDNRQYAFLAGARAD